MVRAERPMQNPHILGRGSVRPGPLNLEMMDRGLARFIDPGASICIIRRPGPAYHTFKLLGPASPGPSLFHNTGSDHRPMTYPDIFLLATC